MLARNLIVTAIATLALVVGSARAEAEGFIEEVVYLGEARKYRVRLAGEVLIVSQQTKSDQEVFAPGKAVHLGWSAEDLKVVRAS